MKLIGIVGRCYYNKDNQNIIQTHDMVRRMIQNFDDCTCITILPTENINYLEVSEGKDKINKNKLDYVLEKCDAFIIPGGTFFYHLDEYVIKYAIKNDKPLLAICLGFQAMCSMYAKERTKFDMTTRLNLENHIGFSNEYKHNIIINKNTLLYEILKKDKIKVNSLHHDIVDFDIKTLKINSKSDDGIIEGVEYPHKKFILGLQWHPEYLMDENSKKIIKKLIKSI